MSKASPFTDFLRALRSAISTFPDPRTGKNKHYTVRDAALGAFAVFFTQSPPFLAYQRDMGADAHSCNILPRWEISVVAGPDSERRYGD